LALKLDGGVKTACFRPGVRLGLVSRSPARFRDRNGDSLHGSAVSIIDRTFGISHALAGRLTNSPDQDGKPSYSGEPFAGAARVTWLPTPLNLDECDSE
jgi:hypothetical protein